MYRIALIILGVCFYASADARLYSFLKNSPIESFTEVDTTMMMDNVYKALDTKKDGEKLAWQNEKTGNSGLANPLSTYKQDGLLCRKLRIINRSKKQIVESKYDLCKVEDGLWKINSK